MRSPAEPVDPVGHCSFNLSRSHDHARIRNHRVMDDKTLLLGFVAGHNREADLSHTKPTPSVILPRALAASRAENFFFLLQSTRRRRHRHAFSQPCRMWVLGIGRGQCRKSVEHVPVSHHPLLSGLVHHLGYWPTPDIGLST
jgi:hypothetical protein